MAIHKRIRRDNKTHDAAQVTWSLPPDPALAQVIVDAWANAPFQYQPSGGGPVQTVALGDALLDRKKGNPTKKAFEVATQKINQALNVRLKRAVVITEAEHDSDYYMDEDEVVFVLPDPDRLEAGGANLQAAKLLMACTPNGI